MAHRDQHPVVRGAGNAAGRIVRALSRATFLLIFAGAAVAAPTDPTSISGRDADGLADSDAPAWWSSPGFPGWTPSAGLGTAFAWTFAGHSLGGWSTRSSVSAPQFPWPSVEDARRPLTWSDSLAVREGGDGGWLGPDATLATAESFHRATRDVRARAVFRAEGAEFGMNRYSLTFERGDSARWLRYEASSAKHDPFAAIGRGADHIWNLAVGWSRGAHRLSGTIGQRGVAEQLSHADVSEHASGESGGGTYEWARGGRRLLLAFQRGLDHREDIIDVENLALSFSRREGQENRAEVQAAAPFAKGSLAARVAWSEARVVRLYDDAFDLHNTTWWGALKLDRPTADGRLDLELGGGRSGALDQGLFAPSASLTFGTDAVHGRMVAERMVHPVWSDLAPGQSAFLQRTDALGFEAGASNARVRGDVGLLSGLTRDRAIVFPYPIEDIWLRAGATAETRRYTFALFTVSTGATWSHTSLGGSGFALGRDQDQSEPRVEPDFGARAYLEDRFTAFKGDLAVRIRLEGAGIGERESKTGGQEVVLPGYFTSSAIAIVTLADATATLRVANLEDRPHEEPWIDPGTGVIAKGPGRSVRVTFTWRLFN